MKVFFVSFLSSLVRYLHPSDDELKLLIGKNTTVSTNKSKARKGAASDSRFVICLYNFYIFYWAIGYSSRLIEETFRVGLIDPIPE